MPRFFVPFAIAGAVLTAAFEASPVSECSPRVTLEAATAPSLLQQQQQLTKSAALSAHRSLAEPSEILHAGEDCWDACDQKGGYCDWCGEGNACCLFGMEAEERGCHSARLFKSMTFHQCVRVEVAVEKNDAEEEFERQVAAKKAELGIASSSTKSQQYREDDTEAHDSQEDESALVEGSPAKESEDGGAGEERGRVVVEDRTLNELGEDGPAEDEKYAGNEEYEKETEDYGDAEASKEETLAAMEESSGAEDEYAEKISEQDKIAAIKASVEAANALANEHESESEEESAFEEATAEEATASADEQESASEKAWREGSEKIESAAEKAWRESSASKARAKKSSASKAAAKKSSASKAAAKKSSASKVAAKKASKRVAAKKPPAPKNTQKRGASKLAAKKAAAQKVESLKDALQKSVKEAVAIEAEKLKAREEAAAVEDSEGDQPAAVEDSEGQPSVEVMGDQEQEEDQPSVEEHPPRQRSKRGDAPPARVAAAEGLD